MRLIDADRFLEFMEEKCDTTKQLDLIILAIVSEALKEQPTAYDVDKVIEELEKEVERWEDSGKEYKDNCEIAVGRGLRKSIKIVKQGGASDDVCEWKLDGVYLNSPHKPLVSCVTDENYRYYYCPVCGKKIKVVE